MGFGKRYFGTMFLAFSSMLMGAAIVHNILKPDLV
jgi:hypothetical protein